MAKWLPDDVVLTPAQRAKRRYAERNKEKVRQAQIIYYERNKAKVIARAARWIKDNNYTSPNTDANRRRNREYWARNRPFILVRHANKEARRRASKRGLPNEFIDREIVFDLFSGVCGICGLGLDRGNFHLDHIIPLIRGGAHTYLNVQPAYPFCNLSKGGRSKTV